MNDQNAKQNIAQDKLIIQNYNRIADNVDALRIAIISYKTRLTKERSWKTTYF